MKQLVRIRLVQFFLYEKQEVTIGRNCGIFGANASGKSSLLDAVQIVMFGASTDRSAGVALNAQAEENTRTTRSLRSYCLGKYGDADHSRVRDHATTYITLIWKDTDTGEAISTGVCISASVDREKHEVLGRYIVPGELKLADHLDTFGSEERPRDWGAFRVQLDQRANGGEVVFSEAKRFLNAMLLALRGAHGAPSLDTYRQAFRFGLRMRFDSSVDDIVRHQVLEARPTNVSQFKVVLATFQEMAAKVRDVHARLEQAAVIEKDFERADLEQTHAISWDSLEQDAGLEVANEALGAAEEAEGLASRNLDEAVAELAEAKTREIDAKQAADDAVAQQNRHASHANVQLIQDGLKDARESLEKARREFRRNLSALKTVLATPIPISGSMVAQSDEMAGLARDGIDRLLGTESPTLDQVERVVRDGVRAVTGKYSEALEIARDLGQNVTTAKAEVKREEENKDRVAKGKPPFRDGPVSQLRRLLADSGIEATPVCDLVKIDDPQWQPVIEAFLGQANMQALLVDAESERRAFAIYRGARIFDAKVVMPSRFTDRRSPASGAVADLISGTSAPAINYLRSKLGEFMRAQSEDECFTHRQAMTADGMVVAGGEILRKRPVDPVNFLIGPVTEAMRGAVEDALRRARRHQADVQGRYDEIQRVQLLLAAFAGSENDHVDRFLAGYADVVKYGQRERDSLSKLADLDTAEYRALVVAVGEANKAWAECREATLKASRAVGSAQSVLVVRQQATKERRAIVAQQHDAMAAAREADGYDPAYASDQWEKLLANERLAGSFEAIRAECAKRARNARAELQRAANSGMQGLTGFLVRYGEAMPDETPQEWRAAWAWLSERVRVLHDTGLREYEGKMEHALATAKRTFRTDVAVTIHENVQQLNDTIERMNAALRAAPVFTNGERYRFLRPVRPAYAHLLQFIRDVAVLGPEDDLIGGPGEIPEEFEALMRDKALPGAGAVKSPLDDYREFFDFDVQILRVDATTGVEHPVGQLSKRVGSGSGGEHRAPLYVIAGAAMASAYRIKPGDTSGMRLLMLDEAFVKMDPRNITATMRYFEELGLQIFLASAGDAQGHLSAFLDRYYDIMRDAESNVILLEGHDIDEATRALFREDLPEFNPALIDQEGAAMAAGATA